MIELHGKERCEAFASYVIDTGATVRQAASYFGIRAYSFRLPAIPEVKHSKAGIMPQHTREQTYCGC